MLPLDLADIGFLLVKSRAGNVYNGISVQSNGQCFQVIPLPNKSIRIKKEWNLEELNVTIE